MNARPPARSVAPQEPGRLSVSRLPSSIQLAVWPNAVELHRALERHLIHPVDLWITDNMRSVLRISRPKNRYQIRAHHMFTSADPKTLSALVTLAKGENVPRTQRRARACIQNYIDNNTHTIRRPKPKAKRRVRIRTAGCHHDLGDLYQQVSQEYLARDPGLSITWGRARALVRLPRSIRLGSFDPQRTLIRIHPFLDRAEVPGWVVQFIIYHEILHHLVPSTHERGRYVHHSPRFRELEQQHPDHDRYQNWKQHRLPELLQANLQST